MSGDELTTADITELVAAARLARKTIGLDCYRLFHGHGEGAPGLSIDRYGNAAVIRHRHVHSDHIESLASGLVADDGFELVTARYQGFAEMPRAVVGEIPENRVVCDEGRLSFLCNFARGGNPGLYLDARDARTWLGSNSHGLRVLNLFSFTGSLGIAAAVGGAASVTHVDSHGPTLAWAKANCELNGLRTDDRDFARLNVYQHLRKGQSGRKRYGGIILDPPPGTPEPGAKDRSPGKRGALALAPLASRMLEPGGWLLCFFHHDKRPRAVIENEICEACELDVLWRGTSGADFPEEDDDLRLRITAFVRR